MFALSLVVAFLAPFFSRVFWKSFDEITDLEDRALQSLPKIVNDFIATLGSSGIIALVLQNYAELSIEVTAGVAIAAGAVFLRLPRDTFDSRLIGQIIRWSYSGAVLLKAKLIR